MISRKIEIKTHMKSSFVRSEKLILFHLHLEVLKSDTSSTIEHLKNEKNVFESAEKCVEG